MLPSGASLSIQSDVYTQGNAPRTLEVLTLMLFCHYIFGRAKDTFFKVAVKIRDQYSAIETSLRPLIGEWIICCLGWLAFYIIGYGIFNGKLTPSVMSEANEILRGQGYQRLGM